MTDEEIIKYIKDNYAVYDFNVDNLELAVLMFKDGYEQGATDINVVATHTDNTEVILDLQKDLQIAIDANKKWLKRDTKLEAQIEKMKCCGNCKHEDELEGYCNGCRFLPLVGGFIDKWELAE